jgi:hypothetical protein
MNESKNQTLGGNDLCNIKMIVITIERMKQNIEL